jgi:hypothetical protein
MSMPFASVVNRSAARFVAAMLAVSDFYLPLRIFLAPLRFSTIIRPWGSQIDRKLTI